jgi:hypothetical protein
VNSALGKRAAQGNRVVGAAAQAEETAQQAQQFRQRGSLQAQTRNFILKDAVAAGLGEEVELGIQFLVEQAKYAVQEVFA